MRDQTKNDSIGKMPDRPVKSKPVVRVNWECMVEAPVHKTFNSHLWRNLSCILWEVEDMESEWTTFRTSELQPKCHWCLLGQQPENLLVDSSSEGGL